MANMKTVNSKNSTIEAGVGKTGLAYAINGNVASKKLNRLSSPSAAGVILEAGESTQSGNGDDYYISMHHGEKSRPSYRHPAGNQGMFVTDYNTFSGGGINVVHADGHASQHNNKLGHDVSNNTADKDFWQSQLYGIQ
jgi:prepilin-type processing-associated H-X9-DG protein